MAVPDNSFKNNTERVKIVKDAENSDNDLIDGEIRLPESGTQEDVILANYIKYINKLESTEEVYVFKSYETAKQALEEYKEDVNNYKDKPEHFRIKSIFPLDKKQIISIVDNVNKETLLKIINYLTCKFKKVIFVHGCDNNNYKPEEICRLALKTKNNIYEASSIELKNVHLNSFREIVNLINKEGFSRVFGRSIILNYTNDDLVLRFLKGDKLYITFKNIIILISKARCIDISAKVLTNYTFKITKIHEYNDERNCPVSDLELEVTDNKGNKYNIYIPAKDKCSLTSFRKRLYPAGNFIDCMSNLEFSQIFSQMFEKSKPEIVRVYKKPGLMPDGNSWLYADEVVELEN